MHCIDGRRFEHFRSFHLTWQPSTTLNLANRKASHFAIFDTNVSSEQVERNRLLCTGRKAREMDEYEERTLSVIAPEQQVRIAGCTDHHTSCAVFFFAEIQKVRSQKSEDVSPRGPSGWNWLSSLDTGTQIWFENKWSDLVRGGRAVRFQANSRQGLRHLTLSAETFRSARQRNRRIGRWDPHARRRLCITSTPVRQADNKMYSINVYCCL